MLLLKLIRPIVELMIITVHYSTCKFTLQTSKIRTCTCLYMTNHRTCTYLYMTNHHVLYVTPSRSVASAEQSERASLDSRGSAEASVTSAEAAPGEVAVGNLIDITSVPNGMKLYCY